jgi:hypothetical protein
MVATSTNNVDILMSGMEVKEEPRIFSQSGEYLFTTTSTNRYAKVSVDNQVVFEHSPSDPTPPQGKIYLGTGQHMVKIEALAGDTVQLQWYPIIGSVTPGIVVRTGLKGEYFNYSKEDAERETYLDGPVVVTRIDRIIHFMPSWYCDADHYPALPIGVNQDYFAVRWTGKLHAPITGAYKFQTYSDNGVRLWVNNQNMINFWGHEKYGETQTSHAIRLTAGAWYPIKMEYFQDWGDKYVTLRWALFESDDPNKIRGTWVIVPEDCLSPE